MCQLYVNPHVTYRVYERRSNDVRTCVERMQCMRSSLPLPHTRIGIIHIVTHIQLHFLSLNFCCCCQQFYSFAHDQTARFFPLFIRVAQTKPLALQSCAYRYKLCQNVNTPFFERSFMLVFCYTVQSCACPCTRVAKDTTFKGGCRSSQCPMYRSTSLFLHFHMNPISCVNSFVGQLCRIIERMPREWFYFIFFVFNQIGKLNITYLS